MKYLYIIALLFSLNCSEISLPGDSSNKLTISESTYGNIEGKPVSLFHLKNKNGMVVEVTNYGGIITRIMVPDKNDVIADIVLGYDSLSQYVEKTPYFGAFVGRYANRIANGKFTLDGKEYQLATNNGINTLHGGTKGFDKKIWHAESYSTDESVGVTLNGISPDGEEGYPGNLTVKVIYSLNNDNELSIDYTAETDKSTVINFTNHTYFNLQGATQGSIANHILQIKADNYAPVDDTSIPTGEIASVVNTPFDFIKPTAIGARIDQVDHPQIKIGNGYDHYFVFNKKEEGINLGATVFEPTTGRVLEVLTTEPGLQLYTSNYLGKKFVGKEGVAYDSRDGFCLETQHFPNSPNEPGFPSTVLIPNDVFKSTTIYRFSNRR